MSDRPPAPSRAEREARRALLQEALAKLAEPGDPDRNSEEVMRALDAYLDVHPGELVHAPREPPVANFDRREAKQMRMATWFVLGDALLVTIILASEPERGLARRRCDHRGLARRPLRARLDVVPHSGLPASWPRGIFVAISITGIRERRTRRLRAPRGR